MKGPTLLQVKVLPGERMAHPGSYGGAQCGQPRGAKPSGQEAAERQFANPRAGTRVNPEQAPKDCRGCRSVSTPEKAAACGRHRSSKDSRATRRGTGAGTWRKRTGRHGRPAGTGARHPQPPWRRVPAGVGGAHSTCKVRETGWREGALVPGAFEEGEGQGDWR
jgi:hypothetical protein